MKQLHYFYLFLSLFACSAALVAQEQDSINRVIIDSMKQVLNTQNHDGQRQLELLAAIGIHYNVTGKYDSTRVYLNRALSMPGGREYQGGRLITNLANSYGFEGRYAEALKYYMEALRVSEHMAATAKGMYYQSITNRTLGLFNVFRTKANLAEIHYLTGNRKQALYYAESAKEMWEKDSAKLNPRILYILPQVLYVIGSVHLDRNNPDDAEKMMQETYEMADASCRWNMQTSGNPGGMYMYIAYGKEGLARVSLTRKDYDKALSYAAEALEYAELHGDPTVTAKILAAFSDIYHAQGNSEESGRFARKAMELFPDYPDLNPGAAFNIATASLFAGDREEAYRYFLLYADRMKANTDKQFRETMAGMEVVYETEKKELRIVRLEQEKILVVAIGLIVVLMAIMIWIIFRQKLKNEQKEKQVIAVNAIFEGEKQERKRIARDLHDGVNCKLSTVRIRLASMKDLPGRQDICRRIDECIEEIRFLASGVMPASLQRGGIKAALEDYCYSFSDTNINFYFFGESKRIDEKIELAVYYCASELVHNSVRHSGATTINVHLIQKDKRISLAVQDNGCGYDKESSGYGAGLKNIRNRVMALNGKMEVVSSPGNGTETMIEWKVKP